MIKINVYVVYQWDKRSDKYMVVGIFDNLDNAKEYQREMTKLYSCYTYIINTEKLCTDNIVKTSLDALKSAYSSIAIEDKKANKVVELVKELQELCIW